VLNLHKTARRRADRGSSTDGYDGHMSQAHAALARKVRFSRTKKKGLQAIFSARDRTRFRRLARNSVLRASSVYTYRFVCKWMPLNARPLATVAEHGHRTQKLTETKITF